MEVGLGLTRRTALTLLLIIALVGAGLWRGLALDATRPASSAAVPVADHDPTSYVDPFIGTDDGQPNFGVGGASGNTFPGATTPFGMVQWSPDTSPPQRDHAGGYVYRDTDIRGFSLTHLSGTGCPLYEDVPFMPIVGRVTASPSARGPAQGFPYIAPFSHRDETASPGYYRVRLGSGISVALSATRRTGAGLFTFPASRAATLLINNGGSATGNTAARIAIAGPDEVAGAVTSGHFCGTPALYTLYFVARFDRPFRGYGAWSGATVTPGVKHSRGIRSGLYVSFDTTRDRTVQVRVGLSFVSVRNARSNLEREVAGWDFASVRAAARADWERMLGRIDIAGGTVAERRVFYTALYHVLLFPSTFSDANGQYRGFDNRVHVATYTNAQGATVPYVQYANYSGWDVYRSEAPLLALLAPRELGDMAQSLLEDARQSGQLPKWSIANRQTNVMAGDPADAIIADAYAFGARGFDTAAALRAMLKGATQRIPRTYKGYAERPGLEEYLAHGYVSAERERLRGTSAYVWGPAATTLEYATDDFAIAQFAGALGDRAVRDAYLRRSRNWRSVFDPARGYVVPRLANGRFVAHYDPASRDGFVEGDGAQYTWMVPFDMRGLFAAMGGPSVAARRLDTFFTRLNAGPVAPYAFMGNEPSADAPWAYDFLGQPWRTQDVARRIILSLYDASPGGEPGNDDLGQTSAWYVFAAIGLYPAIPGLGGFAVGSPLFRRVTLHLSGGDLTIVAPKASDGAPYVRSLTLNGRPYRRTWLPIGLIAKGAILRFDLSERPQTGWGTARVDAPPSFDVAASH